MLSVIANIYLSFKRTSVVNVSGTKEFTRAQRTLDKHKEINVMFVIMECRIKG